MKKLGKILIIKDMAEKKDQKITGMDIPWNGYIGKRVEEFIKENLTSLDASKAGYIALLDVDKTTNMATVGVFASAETYAKWLADKEGQSDLLLSSVDIPMGSGGGSTETSYIVKLTNLGDKTITATKKSDLVAKIRFTSQLYDPSDGSTTDTNEDAVLTIQTKMQNASDWKDAGTLTISSQETADPTAYTSIDLSPYINDGTQSVRMIAVGNTSEKITAYVNMTVTLTNITIKFGVSWQKPFEYKLSTGISTISIPAYVSGSINKTLHYKVTSETDSTYEKTYDYALGTTVYSETPYAATINHPQKQGVYAVEAWITSGDTVKTESVILRIMCTVSGDTTPLLVLNDISTLQNWSNVKAFTYAVYNPSAEYTDVSFDFVRLEDEISIYSETVTNVRNGDDPKTLQFNLEYETGDTENFPIQVTFLNASGDTLHAPLRMIVDNSENFAPTSNPDFYLNPKQRNNSESNRDTIINAATGEAVKATISGIAYISDGWLVDENTGVRCLRVLEGSSVDIKYDAYSDDTAAQGLTIELDFAARNVTDEEGHLFDMNTIMSVDNKPLGLWVKAQESCFLTTEKRTEETQDWIYQKDKRTHVAVNIVPNLYGQGINYVRVFINGIISREFVYTDTDMFWQAVDGTKKTGGIVIKPIGADIDIYCLRIYKRSISATEIRQNYLSSFASVDEKKTFKEKNNILGESGLISYAKCYDKYNTILYKGKVPNLKSQASTVGDVVVHKIGDPDHSGTLYNMTRKGQGSTSKKYWTWNVQSDFKTETAKWVDENGVDHGQCYQSAEGLPYAKKLVDKRNWASSQQSHKMGATKMYNDLYQEVVGKNEITSIEGNENCRVCVYEEPFLVFEQEDDNNEPTFIGLGTFGSGKADKPTFGYDKTKTPNMIMIEGSDNNPRLTKHQVPWIDGDVVYDENEEGFVYAGTTSWDYDLGNLDTISRFKDAFNFVYLHSNRLKYYNGTATQLKADKTLDISYQYWVTKAETDAARYDVFRYDEIGSAWVPAGITKNEDETYATLNVKTQIESFLPSDFSQHESYLEWDKVNDDFITARLSEFTSKATTYFHKQDILFSMAMMKLLAGTDNRAKNTYLWVFDAESKIRAFQDDLDSILTTDNQGQLNKPYYVEEHDFDETLNKNYWNGEDNVLYNLMENAYGEELRSTMRSILTAMEKLSGSVTDFWEDYFMSTCQYFPAVAYNEMARIGYEYAHYMMSIGQYSNDTDPITQSLGSQEEGERQWCIDRTAYMSSYAMYGEFAQNPTGNNINYRSTEQMTVHFDLTPAMWLYPVVTVGQSVKLMGKRVKAGEKVSIDVTTDSNTQNIVCGVDYMNDIGTWYDKPANGVFAFNGKRIKSLVAGADNTSDIHLAATGVSANTLLSLRTFDMHNISTLQGLVDLSKLSRLESIDLRGTKVTSVTFPTQEFLTSVKLPSTITTLRLNGQYGLGTINLEGWTNLQTFYINQNTSKVDTYALLSMLKTATQLSSLTLYNVDWSDVSLDDLTWLIEKQAKVTGRMKMADDVAIDATTKMKMVSLWGNVDDESNALYIEYDKVAITRISLSGSEYFEKEDSRYQLELSPYPTKGNNILSVSWAMTDSTIDDNVIDPETGVVTVNKIGTKANNDGAKITATVTLSDGTVLTADYQVYFYEQELQLGDFLYNDGTVSANVISSKVVVGVCFIVNPKDHRQGTFIALSDFASRYAWGLYSGSLSNITLTDDPSYNVYKVPMDNIATSSGYSASSDSSFRDETNVDNDGWKQYLDSAGNVDKTHALNDVGFTEVTQDMYDLKNLDDYLAEMGLKKGDMISAGQYRTLIIMQHRDKILTDSGVNLPVPKASDTQTETDNLKACIDDIVKNHSNNFDYAQYYYPAASYCYAYAPNVGNATLDERLGEHHWHMMSIGEYARMSFHLRKGDTVGVEWACFAKALQLGKMSAFVSDYRYWSSSETNVEDAWGCYPNSGVIESRNFSSPTKRVSWYGRPAIAFKL